MVEEALSVRGIFNKKNGNVTQSYLLNDNSSKNLFDNPGDFTNNEKLSIDTNLGMTLQIMKNFQLILT